LDVEGYSPLAPAPRKDPNSLVAKGRIYDSKGRVKLSSEINGARLNGMLEGDTVRIRLNDSAISEFWAEVEVPLFKIKRLLQESGTHNLLFCVCIFFNVALQVCLSRMVNISSF
jgi:hypothetical protein